MFRTIARHFANFFGPEPRPIHHAVATVIRHDNDAFAAHLNSSIGKLMSACKRADPSNLPRIKRALAHLNAARTLHSLGYISDARAIVARCFLEVRQNQVAGFPALT
ncbi:hypothetical protein WYO_0145 [Methylobacterium sp. GXF4]|uniref:hypothetical protein n=1 Tax=Methylobacterium sp. GXF4 TaxID=1096546 RepID=UPI0002698C3A|nr:hypothetical protein [Methylobacterium sp. GXF4]EIZ87108.1 hypothetical protein WYO_0145 [Methylobacterium sp. GXF4]